VPTNVHVYNSNGDSLFALSDLSLNQPGDVSFDATGNLYVSNPGNSNVMTSTAGTQPLLSFYPIQTGRLVNPTTLTIGPDGLLYVVDAINGTILPYQADGTLVRRFQAIRFFSRSIWSLDRTAGCRCSGVGDGLQRRRRRAAEHGRRRLECQ
jgi:sugar lactone lactonase YvrE